MKKIKLFLLLFLLSIYFLPSLALAETPGNPNPGNPASTVSLPNPLGSGKTDIPQFLGQIINYAMGIIGSLALVMVIYGGVTWMLSGGSSEKVSKGKEIIIWAALGLAIIFTAYALVYFVISAIGGASNGTANPQPPEQLTNYY